MAAEGRDRISDLPNAALERQFGTVATAFQKSCQDISSAVARADDEILAASLSERASWGDFAVSPDGRRLLSISYESRGSEQPITVVLNWPAETARGSLHR